MPSDNEVALAAFRIARRRPACRAKSGPMPCSACHSAPLIGCMYLARAALTPCEDDPKFFGEVKPLGVDSL